MEEMLTVIYMGVRNSRIFLIAALFVLVAAASLASAFSFYDIFAMFGIGAIGDAPIHHTVYLVSPMNNSYTSQTNDSLQFVYNHTGSLSGVVNCTLLLDDIAVNYTEGVAADTNTAVYSNQTIAEGQRYLFS